VKKIKAERVKKCFAKAGLADNLEEAISNLCQGKELSPDTKNFVQSDAHLFAHYSFEPATAQLAVRNTQNKDVEDEEGEEAAGQQDISTKICAHEQSLHCIIEVMQFAINSNPCSLLELLYTVKDCIQKDMNTEKWKQVSLLDLWKKS
jgi:hypothetical protein